MAANPTAEWTAAVTTITTIRLADVTPIVSPIA
jgi:hypothetical protein